MPTLSLPIAAGHRVDNLEDEPHAIADRAAIVIGSLVRVRANELFEQVAVGAVQFDAVEPRGDGVFRGRRKFLDRRRDVRQGHRVGYRQRLHPFRIGKHLADSRHAPTVRARVRRRAC